MQVLETTKKELEDIYQDYLNNEKVKQMDTIHMHRGSTCYIHSFMVAKLAVKRALRRKKKKLDLKSILIASILHDYYLYDWRDNKKLLKGHAKRHPFIAAQNATNDFNISSFVKEIIESHMWPYNFKYFPRTTEARIVCNADTHIAFKEAMTSIKHKKKIEDKRRAYIQKLFD